MKVTIDLRTNTVKINAETYCLDSLKNFLIKHYYQLVQRHFIKAIHLPGYQVTKRVYWRDDTKIVEKNIHRFGRTVFTYDWKEIIRRAAQTILPIQDFIINQTPAV